VHPSKAETWSQDLSYKCPKLAKENSEIDVICVSETWFVQSLCDLLISCDGYYYKYGYYKIICQQTINGAIVYIFLEIKT